MAIREAVPLLGFEGETHDKRYDCILTIPLPPDFIVYEHDHGWRGRLIEIYRWDSVVEGYNVFLPGRAPISIKSAFDVKLIIHDYLENNP